MLCAERGELLGVQLLHHAKAAELPLNAVEIAVVVRVAGDEVIAADSVEVSTRSTTWTGKRQPGDPGLSARLSCR